MGSMLKNGCGAPIQACKYTKFSIVSNARSQFPHTPFRRGFLEKHGTWRPLVGIHRKFIFFLLKNMLYVPPAVFRGPLSLLDVFFPVDEKDNGY